MSGAATRAERPRDDDRPVGLVANLGRGRRPNGQTMKARELLALLESSGRRLEVVDVSEGVLRLLRIVRLARGGRTIVIVLNRRGLWVALALVGLVRRRAAQRSVVIVPVVGGWLPGYLGARRYRRLAEVADEFMAETPQLVEALRAHGVPASELANFRRMPVDPGRVRSGPHTPLRLCFSSRVRSDKGVVLAAQLVERLTSLGVASQLDIYGPVEDKRAFQQAMAITGVTYRGTYATADEALRILSDYDFLVLPTSYEGECMPGIVVEAGYAALPAVVSDWKDLGGVVLDGVTGFVCPLDDFVATAARRVRCCVEGEGLPDLSRGALEQAASRFTEAAARDQLLDRIRWYERIG